MVGILNAKLKEGLVYLERYRAGEYTEVWKELYGMGYRIREPEIHQDAYAVACATMRRAKANVETIVERLQKIGYQFGLYPDGTKLTYYAGPSHHRASCRCSGEDC